MSCDSLPIRSFVCPITCAVMVDPVMAVDGHTYERSAIETWFKKSHRSPKTNCLLATTNVVANHTLKQAICEYVEMVAADEARRTLGHPGALPIMATPDAGYCVFRVLAPTQVYAAPSFQSAERATVAANDLVIATDRMTDDASTVAFLKLGRSNGAPLAGLFLPLAHQAALYAPTAVPIPMTTTLAVYCTGPTRVRTFRRPTSTAEEATTFELPCHTLVSTDLCVETASAAYVRLEGTEFWVPENVLDKCNLNAARGLCHVIDAAEVLGNALVGLGSVVVNKIYAGSLLVCHGYVLFNGHLHCRVQNYIEQPPSHFVSTIALCGAQYLGVLREVQEDGSEDDVIVAGGLPTDLCDLLAVCVRDSWRIQHAALGPHDTWFVAATKKGATAAACWASANAPARLRNAMKSSGRAAFGNAGSFVYLDAMTVVVGGDVPQELERYLAQARRVYTFSLHSTGGAFAKTNNGVLLDKMPTWFATDVVCAPKPSHGDLRLVALSGEDYVAVYEHACVASPAVPTPLSTALTGFYTRHLALRAARRRLILQYEATTLQHG
ncbi:hypothetical protein SPRG_03326 [Saprolegnia parasitica CBS 223.65]|uniref:U-box domain-containing protein n=1 Tax=Saprolegnia parasitica (strain CBS 223.65) TaxID=695850 RepID=A0A067CNM9_SAPPC|nr:hypothetical protein SPRG_03326 [Saprolegnia parasitica CBS 223.65]KDO32108.1 hypothetical protein SPRG_03326 [Saprolegnia parasitica CBS 223.65]|eukprot:XP_012197293.1 hypothetical protein SPRG_03326 [Saprolegnia parasitica CBS 223.65]